VLQVLFHLFFFTFFSQFLLFHLYVSTPVSVHIYAFRKKHVTVLLKICYYILCVYSVNSCYLCNYDIFFWIICAARLYTSKNIKDLLRIESIYMVNVKWFLHFQLDHYKHVTLAKEVSICLNLAKPQFCFPHNWTLNCLLDSTKRLERKEYFLLLILSQLIRWVHTINIYCYK